MKHSVLNLINEIEQDIDNKCFYSALSLALTLPDICCKLGKNSSNRQDYVNWCNSNLKTLFDLSQFDYSFGDIVYALRCSILHSGNTRLHEQCSMKNKKLKLHFMLKTTDNLVDINSLQVRDGLLFIIMNVVSIIQDICNATFGFYNALSDEDKLTLNSLLSPISNYDDIAKFRKQIIETGDYLSPDEITNILKNVDYFKSDNNLFSSDYEDVRIGVSLEFYYNMGLLRCVRKENNESKVGE